MKRFICALLAMLMLCICMPVYGEGIDAGAAYSTYGQYYYKALDESSAAVTGYMGAEEELGVPGEIEGLKVTEVAENAFSGNAVLKKATLPDGITVKAGAFAGCTALKEVFFEGDAVLEESAFDASCAAIFSADVSSSVFARLAGYAVEPRWSDTAVISARPSGVADIVLAWNKIVGAQGYAVYRKDSAEAEWTEIACVTELEYTDRVASQREYYYTVCPYVTVAGEKCFGPKADAAACGVEFPAPTGLSAAVKDLCSVELVWNALEGAEGYCIFRAEGNDDWQLIGSSDGAAYTDASADINSDYRYTVCAYVTVDGEQYRGSRDEAGVKAATGLAEPTGFGAKNVSFRKITLTWNPVAMAEGYNILRKNEKGQWEQIGTTLQNTFTDTSVLPRKNYVYSVQPYVVSDGETVLGRMSQTGVACYSDFLETKQLTLKNTAINKVSISWQTVEGATAYRVLRKNDAGTWVMLKDVTGTSYTDTGLTTGKTYKYAVAAYTDINGVRYWSRYNTNGYAICAGLSAPANQKAVLTKVGQVTVSWAKSPYAGGYYVYRKEGSGKWTKIATTSRLYYVDNKAVPNKTYSYSVVPYARVSRKNVAGEFGKGVCVYSKFAAPSKVTAKNTDVNKMSISWTAIPGVTRYTVIRMNPDGKWVTLKNVRGTSYTDTSVSLGKTYKYAVRGYVTLSRKTYYGSYGSAASAVYSDFAAPKLTSAANSSFYRVTVKWQSNPWADGYYVLRKNDAGQWVKIGDTRGLSYEDKTAAPGKTYTYTVQPYAKVSRKTLGGGYNKTGLSAYSDFSAPKSVTVKNTDVNTVTIKWSSVAGAATYRVLRMDANGNWQVLKDVKGTSYVDATAKVGSTYKYAVRGMATVSGKTYYGKYNSAGYAVYSDFAAPKLTSAKNTDYEQVTVTWNSVVGADGYKIFRKQGDGEYAEIGTVPANVLKFTDKAAKDGVSYNYRVRAYANTASGTMWSRYDEAGIDGMAYFAAPALVSAQYKGYRTAVLMWKSVVGADMYNVYRRTDGEWEKIGRTKGLGFTDTSAVYGAENYYTVRPVAVVGNGNEEGTRFDETGLKVRAVFAAPKVNAVSMGYETIDVSWNSIAGATEYRVLRAAEGESWNGAEEIYVSGTSYRDTAVDNGAIYRYAVAAANRTETEAIGDMDEEGTEVTALFIAPQPVSAASVGYKAIRISWEAVEGASGYRVLRKQNGGEWQSIAETSEKSYIDITVEHGEEYGYTVQAFAVEDGIEAVSEKNSEGLKATAEFVAPSGLKINKAAYNNVNISWTALVKADGYEVYRKLEGESQWVKLADAAENSYIDTDVVCGKVYRYAVAGVAGTAKGAMDEGGIKATPLPDVPVLTSIKVKGDESVTVAWKAAEGATGYYVYRRTASEGWKYIGSSRTTSYTDRYTKRNVVYTYSVRSYVDVNGGVAASALNDSGITQRVPYKSHFHQGDSRWGFSRSLAKKACVLASFSMLLKNSGVNVTPKTVYAANGNSSGMYFGKALKTYGRKYVPALDAKSKYYNGYNGTYGYTYIKNPETNAVAAIKEALDRNPEGVLCYFVKGREMHAVVAMRYSGNTIYFSDPGRVYSRGYNVTWKNTWCYVGHRMSYKHLSFIMAID